MPSYLTRSPSGYSCTHNYRITTSIHINTITTLSDPTSTSLLQNTGTNSFYGPNVCSLSLSVHLSTWRSVGIFVRIAPLPFPDHRHQSQSHSLCSVALARIAVQRSTIRSTCVQSTAKCRRHVLLDDRSEHGSADDQQHSFGESGRATVHQSVHDARRSTTEQHQDRVGK